MLTDVNLNLLTSVRWLAYLPVQTIDPDLKSSQISFNLTDFDVSPVSIASNAVYYGGYTVDMPAYVRTQDKTITFNYMPDSSLSQYRFLYNWISKITVEEGSGYAEGATPANFMVPIRVAVLSEFKNMPMEFVFENSWISDLGPLSFSYQDPESRPIKHSFSVKYAQLTFDVK